MAKPMRGIWEINGRRIMANAHEIGSEVAAIFTDFDG